MSDRSHRIPTYRLKKCNGHRYGVVSLPDGLGGRRDILLGRYGTKESRAEYARVIAEWEAADRRLPQAEAVSDLTINELLIRYWPHAEQHYRHEDGTPTGELNNLRLSFRPLKQMYGHTAAKNFGPLALKALRQQLVTKPITTRIRIIDPDTRKAVWKEKILRVGMARGVINQRCNCIRRLFRWAVENELVPPAVLEGLRAVRGLQRGRTDARETEPVRPVSAALVRDTLPHLAPTVADMVCLLLLTGMRAGELVIMRACDIDITGPVWLYRPKSHKTTHRGYGRIIPLGHRAQEIIRRYLKSNIEAFLFSPRDSMAAFRARQRQERKSKVQPSQVCRARQKPRRKPGERYEVRGLAHAISRACEKAALEHWHLHQLRHSAATIMRREFGLDATRAVLGQHAPQVTEMYAELDLGKAVEVARKLG